MLTIMIKKDASITVFYNDPKSDTMHAGSLNKPDQLYTGEDQQIVLQYTMTPQRFRELAEVFTIADIHNP
jgi:hypothetical protein